MTLITSSRKKYPQTLLPKQPSVDPLLCPNPDEPERLATKALRHKDKMIIKKNFVPWCLGGKNLLLDKSFANMM